MYKRIAVTAAILFSILLLISGCGKSGVVASFDGWELTTDDFKTMALQRYGSAQAAAEKSFENLQRLLDDIVARELKIRDGLNKGLDTQPELVKLYEDEVYKSSINKMFEVEILDKMVSEDDIKHYYEKSGEEVHASHILASINPIQSKEAALARAKKARAELMQPDADFTKVAKKYNQDTTAIDGDLGWFGWGVMVDAFQEKCWEMQPGEISEPVLTEFGYHIIKLIGKRKSGSRGTYEEEKERITKNLLRLRGNEVRAAAEEFIDNIKQKRGLTYEDKNIDKIFKRITSKSNVNDQFTLLNDKDRESILATFDNGEKKINGQDVADYYAKVGRGRHINSRELLVELLDAIIYQEYLLKDTAEELGYTKDPDVIKTATEARNKRLSYFVQQNMIKDIEDPTEDQMLEYYNANQDKYMNEPQFTLIEILVKEKTEADELIYKIKGGENMRDLAIEHSTRPKAKENKGILGPLKKSQFGIIGREAAKAKIGELKGPFKYGPQWTIFKVISKEEPSVKSFDSVKRRVKENIKVDIRKERETVWMDSLHTALHLKVNYAPLKSLFAKEKADLEKQKAETEGK